jgi:gephyrin
VSRIYASEDLPDCIVLLSPGGDVTVLDIDLATQKGEWKSHVDSPLLASYMFPKASASFLPAHPVAPLATLVLLFSSASSVQVCVLSIHGNEVTTVLDESIAVDGVSGKLLTKELPDIFLDRHRSIL